jgi:hypothetical protein
MQNYELSSHSLLLLQGLLITEGQAIYQGQLLAFSILNDLELPCNVAAFEGRCLWLATFRQKDREGVLVAIENQVLPY